MIKDYFHVDILASTPLQKNKLISESFENYNVYGVTDFSLDEQDIDKLFPSVKIISQDIQDFNSSKLEQAVLASIDQCKFSIQIDSKEAGNYLDFLFRKKIKVLNSQLKDIEDWNSEWKRYYREFKINDRLNIVPVFDYNKSPDYDENKLFIYPGMGFGTGTHETTQLCLNLFSKLVQNSELKILDYGCGSGILALATLFYGKQEPSSL